VTTTTRLMTFAEFEQLPDPQFGRYELRHGEPVIVPPAKFGHMKVQQMLRDLLDQAAAGAGHACTEFGFRPVLEHEYRIADVGYCSAERWNTADPNGYFAGAPDLAIEILSPSNTMKEMLAKRKLCLENGSLEFWVVDIEHRQIEVSTPDGRTITFKAGQIIPLFFAAAAHLNVDAVFA
jgi:Uma2 family endonuclease